MLDINEDGVEELLLGLEDDHFRDVYTIRNGEVVCINMWSTMNLFEDNVPRFTSITEYLMGDSIRYTFNKWKGGEADWWGSMELLEEVNYDAIEDTWTKIVGKGDPVTITEEEFNETAESYKVIDLEMKPITKFPLE